MLVTELATRDLPLWFVEQIPETCPYCGSAMEIAENLSMVKCTNATCISKLTTRCAKLFEDIGVLGMGESRCAGLVKYHNATSPYIIFELCHRDGTYDKFYDYYQIVINGNSDEPYIIDTSDVDEAKSEYKDFIAENGYDPAVCKLQHITISDKIATDIAANVNKARSMLLYEFVRIGNYEGMHDSATKLFKDYTSLDDFYNDLRARGIDFIKEKLDIKLSSDSSIRAQNLYTILLNAEKELKYYVQFIDLKTTQQVVNICISTAVGAPYKNKAEFVRVMNDKYGDKIYLNKLGSVSKNCQYLVWSKVGSATNKVNKATQLNIPILTGQEFDDMLSKMYNS